MKRWKLKFIADDILRKWKVRFAGERIMTSEYCVIDKDMPLVNAMRGRVGKPFHEIVQMRIADQIDDEWAGS